MNTKFKFYLLITFLLFSACEVKWSMEVEFNEDYSGSYKILILLDQDAQFYAVETGQTSIGGLDAILADLPEGYGSSIYQEGNYLGILVRNDFQNTEELQAQLKLLNENDIDAFIQKNDVSSDFKYRVRYGNFSKKEDAIKIAEYINITLGYECWIDKNEL